MKQKLLLLLFIFFSIIVQAQSPDANGVFYTGRSYLPIGLGQVFAIVEQGISRDLVAIEVTHLSKVFGNYECEFVAIPVAVTAPHYTNVETFSIARTQPAKIIDNNDPEKLGRVMVRYNWVGPENKTLSDWMRVAHQYAGQSRGSYHVPEIGDEVVIMFEGDNIDRPFVSHSHYNGQAQPEFFDPKNMIKAWRFRFGQLLKFVEKVGIWLSDPSGNEMHFDEEGGNITVTTPGTLTLNCKDLIINVGENMTTTVGQTSIETVTLSKTVGVGALLSTTAGSKKLHVKGNYREDIDGNLDSETKQERHETSNEGVVNHSNQDFDQNAKNIKYNSGEGTRQN